jgi:hypothetical protein
MMRPAKHCFILWATLVSFPVTITAMSMPCKSPCPVKGFLYITAFPPLCNDLLSCWYLCKHVQHLLRYFCG